MGMRTRTCFYRYSLVSCIVLAACQNAWLHAVTINGLPSETMGMTVIPLVCINIWLGRPRVTVGKNFKSTWKIQSALSRFWTWLTCLGISVHRKLMWFVCQCSQQLLKILPSKLWVTEGFFDLSGCNGFYRFPCCSCFVLPTHSYLNFLDHFSSVNSQLLSYTTMHNYQQSVIGNAKKGVWACALPAWLLPVTNERSLCPEHADVLKQSPNSGHKNSYQSHRVAEQFDRSCRSSTVLTPTQGSVTQPRLSFPCAALVMTTVPR